MINKKHRAASGAKAGQWVNCNAGVKCRNGGIHVSEDSLWQARMMHLDKTGDFLAVGSVPLETMIEYTLIPEGEKKRIAALEKKRVQDMKERSDARRAKKKTQGKPAGGVSVVHVPKPVYNILTSPNTNSGQILFSWDKWDNFKSELDELKVKYTLGDMTKYTQGSSEYFGVDKIEINSELSDADNRRVLRSLNRNMMIDHRVPVGWMKPRVWSAFQQSAENLGVQVSYRGHQVFGGFTGNMKNQVFHDGITLTGTSSNINQLISWLNDVVGR